MDLYFLRHGEAGKKDDWTGQDRERPLTEEGIERMKEVASTIAAMRLGVELILSSPLVRAQQTAEIVARALRPHALLRADARLAPGFGSDELAQVIRENNDRKALMLVGHEPDFTETIAACIGGGRIECRKGGLARVEIADIATLHGTLLWLIPPRVLAR